MCVCVFFSCIGICAGVEGAEGIGKGSSSDNKRGEGRGGDFFFCFGFSIFQETPLFLMFSHLKRNGGVFLIICFIFCRE